MEPIDPESIDGRLFLLVSWANGKVWLILNSPYFLTKTQFDDLLAEMRKIPSLQEPERSERLGPLTATITTNVALSLSVRHQWGRLEERSVPLEYLERMLPLFNCAATRITENPEQPFVLAFSKRNGQSVMVSKDIDIFSASDLSDQAIPNAHS